jgi:2-amino-4-hydroxy-6-hydroxymethyldihydropteridine diphosphokinase
VAQIETNLSPFALLDFVLDVERAGGRERAERWSPRTIDIDVLLYGGLIESSLRLTLPHPGIGERAFVALPLAEMAPRLTLPNGESIAEIAASEAIRGQAIRRIEGLDLLREE